MTIEIGECKLKANTKSRGFGMNGALEIGVAYRGWKTSWGEVQSDGEPFDDAARKKGLLRLALEQGHLKAVDELPELLIMADGKERTCLAVTHKDQTGWNVTTIARRGKVKFDIHVHGDHVSLTSDDQNQCWEDDNPLYVVNVELETWGVPNQFPGNHPNNVGRPAEWEFQDIRKYQYETGNYALFTDRTSLEFKEIEAGVDEAIQNESLRRFDV